MTAARKLGLDALQYLTAMKRLSIQLPSRWQDGLGSLKGLEELTLGTTPDHANPNIDILLPTASAQSLTRMTLQSCYGLSSLNSFANLRDLRTKSHPIGIELGQILKDSTAQLLSLCTQIPLKWHDDGTVRTDWEILSCPCLSLLKKLELQVLLCFPASRIPPVVYIESCMLVLEKLTECLPFLEGLKVWARLDVGCARWLNRLRNIQSLF